METKDVASDRDPEIRTELQKNILTITPKMFLKFSAVLIFLFFIAHITGLFLANKYPHSHIALTVDKFFNLDYEATFPAFFSSILLLTSSVLLFVIATQKEGTKYHRHWQILGLVLLFLCFDEAVSIHEEVEQEVKRRLFKQWGFSDLHGLLYYSWVIPYALFFVAAVFYFLKFVLSLSAKTRNLFILAGCVYVLGALGCELIGGVYVKNSLSKNSINAFVVIEEVLEMSALSIFVYALLHYTASLKIRLFCRSTRQS